MCQPPQRSLEKQTALFGLQTALDGLTYHGLGREPIIDPRRAYANLVPQHTERIPARRRVALA
jgi:hypothetical protein